MIEWSHLKGLSPYLETLERMESRVADIIAGTVPEAVWLLEHPPLYTAGTSAQASDLKINQFPTYSTGRGGQWTYHGPGQRVAYVMLNLKARGQMDVRAYVARLEQWIIATLAHFGVTGEIREGRVGVWVVLPSGREAKIAALGIRIRKWVTFHGIAINVHPDLSHYNGIIPCGIAEHGVTSLHALGIKASLQEVDVVLQKEFAKIFS